MENGVVSREDTLVRWLSVSGDNHSGGGNRQTETYVAELFAQKSTKLSGATIDAYGVGITHVPPGVATLPAMGPPNNALLP